MKKRVISSIALMIIAFMLGLTNYSEATYQNIENENVVVRNEIINTTQTQENTQGYGANDVPTEWVNNINDQLQNMNSTMPKDNRRAVAVTIIIIITVALIAILIVWYYMTNQ